MSLCSLARSHIRAHTLIHTHVCVGGGGDAVKTIISNRSSIRCRRCIRSSFYVSILLQKVIAPYFVYKSVILPLLSWVVAVAAPISPELCR